jgi:serine/threonine protein kinase
MHTNGFFHRDLSLQNIFIKEVDDSSIEIRIGCFNTARETNGKPPLTDYVSTRFIRSPEQLLRISNYDCKIDMFSLGCIMVELFNMAPLFSGSDDVEQLTQLCRILGTPTNAEWPDFALLVQKMNIDMMSQ